jgi:hypothetical protein
MYYVLFKLIETLYQLYSHLHLGLGLPIGY